MKRPKRLIQHNKRSGIPIYRGDGQTVGRVEGDTFYKTAHSTRHMLRLPPAWAADLDTLNQAKEAGAVRVQIKDLDTGKVYAADLADFYRYGQRVTRGHGVQLALVLGRWSVNGGRPTVAGAGQPQAAGPSQLRLF